MNPAFVAGNAGTLPAAASPLCTFVARIAVPLEIPPQRLALAMQRLIFVVVRDAIVAEFVLLQLFVALRG